MDLLSKTMIHLIKYTGLDLVLAIGWHFKIVLLAALLAELLAQPLQMY